MIRQLIILLPLLVFFALPAVAADDVASLHAKAEKGDAEAQYLLGHAYENFIGVGKRDYVEAMKWYRKAAEQGNAEAQEKIGRLYVHGKGVKQDYAAGAKWYRKAAEQGNAYAQDRLGGMYERGQGVPQDYAKAMKWYRKAAGQRGREGGQNPVAAARSNLARMYERGLGVKQDWAEAYFWYRLARRGFDAYRPVKHLTREQKAAVDKRVEEWRKAHPAPATAAPPSATHP